MLKIMTNKTETEDRWTLHGQLTGPGVSELRTIWWNSQGADEHRRSVFDPNDVTFADKAGEKLSLALAKEGAQFEAGGIYIRGVLSQWRENKKCLGRRINPQNLSANSKSYPRRKEGETVCPQKL